MIRWLTVTLTLLALLLGVWGVRAHRPPQYIFDEVSAYELVPERPLRVRVPGGVSEAIFTSWAVVAPRAEFDARATYRYGVDVALRSPSGAEKKRWSFTAQSRVSHDPRKPLELGDYTARLAEATDWLADARTQRVDLSALGEHGGIAELTVREASGLSRVMVRLTYLEPLGEIERDLRQRTLKLEHGRRMVEGRSSLGFADLPASVRERALGSFERRLPALGRDGVDYSSRTLWIGHRIPSPVTDEPVERTHSVGPERFAALNFGRSVSLRIHGAPGIELSVRAGSEAPYGVAIGPSGQRDLALEAATPRTVAIGSTAPASLRFSLGSSDSGAQIGAVESPVDAERVFIGPDVRIQRHYVLNPLEPVRVRIGRGQAELGLTLRGVVRAGHGSARVRAAVREPTSKTELEPFEEEIEASWFDTVGGLRVTAPRHVVVVVPPGAERVEILGSPETLVIPWVREPGVGADEVEPEYDVELEEGSVWRNVPCVRSTAAAIRAENDRELSARARALRVETPVRIEPLRSTGPALVERVLEASGAPLGRLMWIFTPNLAGADDLFWWLEPDRPVELRVPPAAEQDQGLTVVYRLSAGGLGRPISLEVDGSVVREEVALLGSGRFQVRAPAGRRRFTLKGEPGLVAFVSAPPALGPHALKRQLVYELGPGAARDFRFERGPDELLAAFISAARESGPGPVELEFEIDPERRRSDRRRLLRRLTVERGTVNGVAGERVLLGELEVGPKDGEFPHAVARLRVVLGDDLEPGEHVLRLRSKNPHNGRLWVRGVVAGRSVRSGPITPEHVE